MADPRYDPRIRTALRELNRVPGVRTRASCQGRTRPDERTSHAEFAYVLFREPLPLQFEEHLLAALGDLARIGPDSVYCRWPDRNAELCIRLAAAAAEFGSRSRPDGETRIPLAALLEPLERRLRRPEGPPLAWCFDCGALRIEPETCAHEPLALLDPEGSSALATFDAFLAADPRPPDPKLREREGDAAVLERLERGDFGAAYRRAWIRFVTTAARQALRVEVRSRVAALRAAGEPVDYWLERGKVVFRRGTCSPASPSGDDVEPA